jgi:hypothetical protein
MATSDDVNLIPADEPVLDIAFTAAELKVAYNALQSYFSDFGHDAAGLHQVVRGLLAKFPNEHEIRAIDLDAEVRKLRELRGA